MADQKRLTDTFCSLVSIDSPSFGERCMADELSGRLKRLGAEVYEDDAGEKLQGSAGNLLARWKGSLSGDPLLFSMHMDTVAPAAGKRPLLHKDGRITSDGTTVLGADDMSGMAALLEAMEEIREEEAAHRDMELLLTVGEEAHLRGSAVFDYSLIRAKESYVLDLSGPVGTAANRAPSLAVFTAEIRGRAAHAAFAPETGIHALQTAAKAVAGLKLGRVDEQTTVNIGSIQSGTTTNIVPDYCRVKGEVRSLCHEKLLDKLWQIQDVFTGYAEGAGASCSFQTEVCFQAYETPPDHPCVRRFGMVCEKLKIPWRLTETFGGSDQHHLCANGIPGIVLSSGMHQVHSCREYTTVQEMVQVAELVKGLLTAS